MKRERMGEHAMNKSAEVIGCEVSRKPYGRYAWYVITRKDTDRTVIEGDGATITEFFNRPGYAIRTRVAMAAFPETFALAGWPGKTFRINADYSYIDDSDTLKLVIDVLTEHAIPAERKWLNFSKGTEQELLAQVLT